MVLRDRRPESVYPSNPVFLAEVSARVSLRITDVAKAALSDSDTLAERCARAGLVDLRCSVAQATYWRSSRR